MEFLSIPLWDSTAVLARFADLPGSIVRGSGPESFVYIPGQRENRILLVAHADTCWDASHGYKGSWPAPVMENGWILPTGTAPGLGADDRAGGAILWQLRNSGHSLLVVNGEEDGCRGSNWLMQSNQDIADEINHEHQFMIELDRRNGRDFKCYGVGTDKFRKYVEKATGYSEPDPYSFTDICVLCRGICGVNLSVGYKHEHGWFERLCINEWQHTLNLCRGWLAAADLPRFALPTKAQTQRRKEWNVDSDDLWFLLGDSEA
jgi:hypothetical protein